MAILQQIPKKLAFQVWNNESEVDMGRFKVDRHGYLKHVWSRIYINGPATNERIRINVYSHQRRSATYAQSSWSSLSEIENLSSYWLGFVRFDFNLENIEKNELYYFGIEIDNYIRNGNVFFVGVSYDFPFPTHDLLATDWKTQPLSAKIFLKEDYGF